MFKRRIATVAFTAVLVVAGATQADAGVTKSGTVACTTNQTAVTHAYSTGNTEHFPPAGYHIFYNGSIFRNTSLNSSIGGGGFWFVETTGSLNSPGTYAYCITGTP